MSKNINNPQKLELTWIGKGDEPKLEPRILIENPEYSYGDPTSENMLIHGDNLLALKALEQDYAGKVKCIYIDPPYNTGNAFEHYDDGIEHSLWLSLLNQRCKILKKLLSEDGSIWITLDDNESHYCKIMCDEIFGRQNFVGNVVWEKADSPRMDAKLFSTRHDHILVYSKNIEKLKFNRLENNEEKLKHYNKVDEFGRKYYLKPLRAMGGQGDSREARPSLFYPLIAPDGSEVFPIRQDRKDGAWRWNKEKVEKEKDRIEWIKTKNGWSANSRLYLDNNTGRPAETIWFNSEVGTNRTSKAEIKAIFKGEVLFDTPKPEKLIERILRISTEKNEIVLDSFLGSGTTAAVAHKMGRKWITVELGEHAITHCYPRLKQVVDGEQGGISKAVNWNGGGGFKFYTLAPSLLNKDKFGNWVINKDYNPEMLAAAMAKQEGFRFQPDPHIYWKQGISTEKDFIFTTTQFITVEMLDRIHDEMQPDENLLICCKIYSPECEGRHPNISIKKIPSVLMGKCEFGKEDYSFNIVNLPIDREEMDLPEEGLNLEEVNSKPSPKKKDDNQASLFD
jgi:adenine-specific DNA-methyltransferase